jgi:peptidoglycan/xylan/chitin deacetylase (PgdA/CDA1 family)
MTGRLKLPAMLLAAIFGVAGCGGGGGGSDKVAATQDTQLKPETTTVKPAVPDTSQTTPPPATPAAPTQPDPQTGGSGAEQGGPPHTEPPPPPPPPIACNGIITRCLDTGAAAVAKYRDNKQAAASYTFDDGYDSSTRIAAIFENHGARASFYINPGNVAASAWDTWRQLQAAGHEIGNHSMTHTIDLGTATVTDQQLETEINDARRLLEQKLGARPMVFAFPWHSYSARSLKIASQNHLAVRNPTIGDDSYHFVFFDQEHGTTPAQDPLDANKELSDTVAAGGWFVAAGHGVDGDGWSPVTSRFLDDHLTFAAQYADKLWIDTYISIARYRLCRKLLAAEVINSASDRITVRLTGAGNPVLCTEALTVAIPLLESPRDMLRARLADGADLPLSFAGGRMLVNLKPGEEVTVEIVAPQRP